MTVKDFNCHKSNGGITQPTTIDATKTFKHSKKGTRASSSHRASGPSSKDSETCSKCNTMHSYKDCPVFGKKCHKCSFKNHFSSCCRSTRSNGQGQEWRKGRTPAQGRSTERCHRPNRGRCSRSRSHSRSGSQTRNTHSIEIHRYDIDDINVLRTFHSISRSKTVASISNDTDPDRKTKIVTKLIVKLPYRNSSRHNGSESRRRRQSKHLTFAYFQINVPSQIRWWRLPHRRFPQRIKDNTPMLQRRQAGESWNNHTATQALLQRIHFKTISSLL